MPANIGFDLTFIPPLAFLERDLRAIGADIRSFREPLTRAIKEVMAPSIGTNFEVGGRPPWEPLSEGTLAVRDDGGQILDRTGTLKAAAQQLNVDNLPETAWYGVIHQNGGGFIPARVFVNMQPEDEDQVEEVFVKWFGERLGAHGFDVDVRSALGMS
jgi:phage gpG-like protein